MRTGTCRFSLFFGVLVTRGDSAQQGERRICKAKICARTHSPMHAHTRTHTADQDDNAGLEQMDKVGRM